MMNNDEREKLWSAYLDGELSASESARFDQSLTQPQRERLAAEMRFESALTDVLSRDAACPEEVWRRTLARAEHTSPSRAYPVRKWLPAALGLAAAIAVVIVSVVAPHTLLTPSFLALSEDSHPAGLAVSSNDPAKVQRYLQDLGVDVRLVSFESAGLQGHEDTRILGAREIRYGQEPVYEVYYECCGRPLKIALAKKGSAAASLMDGKRVQLARDIGGFRAALIGNHRAPALLNHIEAGVVQPS